MDENSFYIETYGCTSNKADSYIISNVLEKANFNLTTLENAQFIIINTCAVKEQTENRIKSRLIDLHKKFYRVASVYIIIAGCLPFITPTYINTIKKIIPSFSAIIGLDNFTDLPDIIRQIKLGKKGFVFKSEKVVDKAKFSIDHPPGKITGIVPISEGCLGSCTYCCVKNARGKLNCYDPDSIIENVRHQLKQGIKQIYLTSQDCSSYKYNGISLTNLANRIVSLDYEFFLRIGMINPSLLINNTDGLISIIKKKKIYQFLHIPIQSGSNKILETMQRRYLISDLIEKCELIRNQLPDLTLSTDIICGFPGETEYDFLRSINFIKWLKPEILNISKFTPRPGTKAKQMKQIDSKIIKQRSLRLSNIFQNSLAHINVKWNGWQGKVLVLHAGSEKSQVFARNFAYKNVLINNYPDGEFGKFVEVKIIKVDGFNLYGMLI